MTTETETGWGKQLDAANFEIALLNEKVRQLELDKANYRNSIRGAIQTLDSPLKGTRRKNATAILLGILHKQGGER